MRDLSRPQQRFLNLPGARRPRSDREAQAVSHVTFSFQAKAFLTAQLYNSGAYRGGPLFGFRSEGDLAIQFAAPAAYACGDPSLRRQPLVLDERYVLGWSDCLETVYEGELDWVGQWLVSPDSQEAALEQDVRWLRAGLGNDLFDEEHLLVTVGWAQGVLSARVYGYDRQTEEPLTFSHDLTGDE